MMRAPLTGRPIEPWGESGGVHGHRSLATLAGLVVSAALIAACGSTSSPASSGSVAAAATTTVKVAMATVSGSSEQVLTAANGFTLYYNTQDTSATPSCTGSCASIWPPLTLSSGQPTASQSLSQSLTAVTEANGRQVEYAGHPLYEYSQDSAPAQANGEGKGGIWFVATPSLTSGSSATSSASAASAPNGY